MKAARIPLEVIAGRRIAVMGLGRSGLASAQALMAAGVDILAWDDDPGRRLEAQAQGVPLTDLADLDWRGVAFLVLSPGIAHRFPKPHPIALQAQAAQIPIIGDIELLLMTAPKARILAITGTNGKSTTTALTGHILANAGVAVAVGGNFGPPALSLPPLPASGVYVLEISSYQLELTPSLAADVAVLLNISPDHLDRHGDMAGYVAAKALLFQGARHGVLGCDDDWSRALAPAVIETTRIATSRALDAGLYRCGSWLMEGGKRLLDLGAVVSLAGAHNAQNAAAAFAACRALGLEDDAIIAGITSFPGLAHRQEPVATIQGVRFINDSKATNADAALRALDCYQTIYWIAGGIAKAGGIAQLGPYLSQVRHAHLIGQAAADFAATLKETGVPHSLDHDLASAVGNAFARARQDLAQNPQQSPVVLLSPACASFDQYADFEARGDHFRLLVENLAKVRS